MIALKFVLLIIGAYFIGNISFARILAKTQKDNITSHGSGNPGSMNMLRTHGVSFGFFTMILDMVKGAIPSIAGFFLFGGFDGGVIATIGLYVGGTSAVIGHIFPVIYKFKGGKGIATAAGLACVAHPIIALILFGCYVLLLIITRIGSVSSLLIATTYIIYDCVTLGIDKNYVCLGLLVFVLVLIIFMHRSNIKRLIEKKENVIDLQDAVNKDVERINKLKEKNKNKKNKNVNNEINKEEETVIEIEEKDIKVNETKKDND